MDSEIFRIFVNGRGTHVFHAKGVGQIIKASRGRFLNQTFASLNEAQVFCRVEVRRDRKLILCLMRGDDILETFLHSDYQKDRDLKIHLVQSLLSMIPVGACSVWLCLKTAPFASDSANLKLAGVMIVIHALCCLGNGLNFFEGGCAMAFVLVLAVLLFPALHRARIRREKQQQKPAALMTHPWDSLPSCAQFS
jgi:hypothetical protein